MMQCSYRFSPTDNTKGWSCGDGRALVPRDASFADTLLEFDIIHDPEDQPRSKYTTVSALRARAYLWDESGQGYVSEAEAWYDAIWGSFFDDEVDYTHNPEEFLRRGSPRDLKGVRTLQMLEDPIKVIEYCSTNRAMWLNCRNAAGTGRAAGETVAVLVRQKKLDFDLHIWGLWVDGRFRELYAVASDIRAVNLEGPLVAKLSMDTLFGQGWPKRFSAVERACPDPVYQSVRLRVE